MHRRRVAALVATFASLAGLVALEVGVRLAKRWNVLPGASPAPTRYDPEIGWVLSGPHRQRHVTAEFDVLVRIDARGRRVPSSDRSESPMPPSPIAAGASARRPIVFAGDSTTFGWGVEAEAAFPEVVGVALGRPVINLGVPGYGVDQSVRLLEREGFAERPLGVVLTLSPNDLVETSAGISYGRTKLSSRLVDGRLEISPAETRSRGWLERSTLFTALSARWAATSEAAGDRARTEKLALVEAWIERARESCRTHQVQFLVVEWQLLPGGGELSADRAVVRAGPLFDHLEAAGTPAAFPRDRHWRPEAHAALAQAIVARLASPKAPGAV
jgi:hypothetical protein